MTVGEDKLTVVVMSGRASLPDGSIIKDEAVSRGMKITITADEPENQALRFKEWDITGANIDKTESPVSFTITDDIVARAVYTEAEGYEDKGDYPHTQEKVKSLKLTDTDKNKRITGTSIAVNGLVSVNATAVYDSKSTEKPYIEFRSSNTDVVKVKTSETVDGKAVASIVGCKSGVATVTAYCGNKKAELKVTVVEKDVEDIELWSERMSDKKTSDGQYRLELKSGEQELVDLYPYPFDSTAELKVTWKSDDTKVATVKDGLITAKGADRGRTTIRVTVKSRPYGAKKWITHEPVLIAVNVKKVDTPVKISMDKSYRLTLNGSQKLELDAGRINKKNVVSECNINVKIRGTEPAALHWATTNEDIVSISSVNGATAKIKATGIGTAYITVTGSNVTDEALINRAVMKVTVTATSPTAEITSDSLGLISDDGKTLKIKAGSYDRLYSSITTDSVNIYNVSQAPSWKSKGNVTVKNGVLFAKKATKPGKPSQVILKSGKSEYTLNVIVE